MRGVKGALVGMETSIAVTTMERGEGRAERRVIKKPLFGTRELCDFDVSGSARPIAQKSQVTVSAFEVSSRASETWQLFSGDREKSFDFPRGR